MKDIDLSQFELKDELNPSIWENDGKDFFRLKSGVQQKLLNIASKFWDSLGFEDDDIDDILLVGSSCNYNWSDVSDLDVHLSVPFKKIDENIELLEDYFKTKSRTWNDAHENLHIGNTPIELFVQDKDAECESLAVYSLLKEKWIKKPKKSELGELKNDREITNKAALLMTIVDGIEKAYHAASSAEEYSEIYDDIQDLLSKIMGMRKEGLARGGEMDKDNIVYKMLRRSGHLETVWDLSDKLFDKVFSKD